MHLKLESKLYHFTYGRSYLARKDAMPAWLPELPLEDRVIVPEAPAIIAGSLRDAAPDQWGRRVVLNRQFKRRGKDVDTGELDELTVTSRKVIWLFSEQLRLHFVPVLHRLQGCLAAEG